MPTPHKTDDGHAFFQAGEYHLKGPPAPNWEITLRGDPSVRWRAHFKKGPLWLHRIMWRLAFGLVFTRI